MSCDDEVGGDAELGGGRVGEMCRPHLVRMEQKPGVDLIDRSIGRSLRMAASRGAAWLDHEPGKTRSRDLPSNIRDNTRITATKRNAIAPIPLLQ
jgi:hypothetical protein